MRQITGDCPRLKGVKSEDAEREVCLNCDAPECWEDIAYDKKWTFIRRERELKRSETDRGLTSDEGSQPVISATD